jgi:hypothetical protein
MPQCVKKWLNALRSYLVSKRVEHVTTSGGIDGTWWWMRYLIGAVTLMVWCRDRGVRYDREEGWREMN